MSLPEEAEGRDGEYDPVPSRGVPMYLERRSGPRGLLLCTVVAPVEDRGEGCLLAVIEGVTALRRAKAPLRDRAGWQRLLLGLSDALRVEPDAEAVAGRALAMLPDRLGLGRRAVVLHRAGRRGPR